MKNKVSATAEAPARQRTIGGNWKTQLGYYAMLLLPAAWIFLTNYIPMLGIYLGFIDYKPAKGFLGSDWVGLKHLISFFSGPDLPRVLRNTLFYNIATIILISLGCGVFFALLLYEIRRKVPLKIYHTCMLLPSFISWTVFSAALQIVLNTESGLLNQLLAVFGMHPVSWYRTKEYWPTIIMVCMVIKHAGMSSIYFYSALLSIDTELFAAARLDGANRFKQIIHISLPSMSKVLGITMITQMGSILSSSLAPYYQLTLNNGELYDTTLTLGIYMYNGLSSGRYSYTTAVGLAQSLIGLALVVLSNTIVRRIDPDSSLF